MNEIKYRLFENQRWNTVESESTEKYFDLFEDFDLIWSQILKDYNIDIRKKDIDIDWFDFKFILDNLLNCENSLSQRLQKRSTKKPKQTKDNRAYIKSLQNYQAKYKLKDNFIQSKEKIDSGLDNFVSFLKSQGKEIKK